MDADVVIERSGLGQQAVARHGRGVLARSEEVDFDQVDFAAEHLTLFAQVQVTAVFARRLVAVA